MSYISNKIVVFFIIYCICIKVDYDYIVGILEKYETLNYLDETYIPDLSFDGIFI